VCVCVCVCGHIGEISGAALFTQVHFKVKLLKYTELSF